MSDNQLEKSCKDSRATLRQLIVLLIVVFGLLICVLAGVLNATSMLRTITVEKSSFGSCNVYRDHILGNAIERLAQSIDNCREELKSLSELSVEEDQPKTPEELYTQYIYEITTSYYPKVDPRYVKAIVYHESRFDPMARNSKTGVIGLTQISPKWHTERALSLGITDLYDPYGNLLVCCDILNELTEKESFEYALNFFAGGYRYADRYRNRTSPFLAQLDQIIETFEGGD